MFNNTSKKFLFGFLGIVIVGVLVWVWGMYFSPEVRDKRALIKYFQDLETEYKNDTYGGATPEETLALFIAALEAGDVELASKYFLPDDREKWTALLDRAVDENRIERMKQELAMLKLSRRDNDRVFYTLADENNVVEVQVILKKNQNNVWKITEL